MKNQKQQQANTGLTGKPDSKESNCDNRTDVNSNSADQPAGQNVEENQKKHKGTAAGTENDD